MNRVKYECGSCGHKLSLVYHADPDFECPHCDAWDWKKVDIGGQCKCQ